MKTPDETKKGLECCTNDSIGCSKKCPYFNSVSNGIDCASFLHGDALAYIRQLEAQNDNIRQSFQRLKKVCVEQGKVIQQLETDKQQLEGMLTHMNQLRDASAGRALKMEERVHQLEAERDAAVADIKQMVHDPYEPCFCDYCKLTEEECSQSNCRSRNAFEWRGVQKEAFDDQKAAD